MRPGVKIIELSDKELSNMRIKVRKNVWPKLKNEIGPVFDEVVSTIK